MKKKINILLVALALGVLFVAQVIVFLGGKGAFCCEVAGFFLLGFTTARLRLLPWTVFFPIMAIIAAIAIVFDPMAWPRLGLCAQSNCDYGLSIIVNCLVVSAGGLGFVLGLPRKANQKDAHE